ncbi:hypothetical protein [Streptomyces boninensis]|uniref:hypothetical protein n=1 Tax=Streptomyces boninensis TaxID=2039455 RepID=UPI003B224DC7
MKTDHLTKNIDAFVRAHGGSARAQVAYLGQMGARISLVGEDGEWGDQVAPDVDTAKAALAAAQGVTVQDDFDGEMAADVRTGPYEWRRMAGIQL